MAYGKWSRSRFLSFTPGFVLAALILLIAGCGGGGGGGGDDNGGGGGTTTVTVSGRVADAISGQGVAGATVTYGGATATTNTLGAFSFTVAAPAAAQRATISAPGYRNLGQYNGATVRLSTDGISVPAVVAGRNIDLGTINLYSNDAPPPPPSL